MSSPILEIGLNEFFQENLRKASNDLMSLIESIFLENCGENLQIFSGYIKFTVIQMDMLETNKQSSCNTDRAVKTIWILIKRSFIINLLTLTGQFLRNQEAPKLTSKKQKNLKALEYVLSKYPDIPDIHLAQLNSLKEELANDQGVYLLGIIKNMLKNKGISDKQRKDFCGFFQALNTLRNNYAHFSEMITFDDAKVVYKYMPYLFKSKQGSDILDVYPEDICKIYAKYIVFLDAVEKKRAKS